jgi:hypothetical protein
MGNDLAVGSSCAERVESYLAVTVVGGKAQLRMKPVCWSRYLSGFTIYNILYIHIRSYTYKYVHIPTYTIKMGLPVQKKERNSGLAAAKYALFHCYIYGTDLDRSIKPSRIPPIKLNLQPPKSALLTRRPGQYLAIVLITFPKLHPFTF